MKISTNLNSIRMYLPSLTVLGLFVFALSCGKSSDDSKSTAATPTPTPTVTEAPESAPVAFWLTRDAGAGPVAVRFDSAGRQSLQVDLVSSGVDYGPITALHFLDASTLLYFVNPGENKEMFGTLDIKTGLVKNRAWGSESSIREKFKNAPVGTMFTGFQNGVLHAQVAAGIKTVRYNQEGGLSAQDFTWSDCPSDKLSGIYLVQTKDSSQIVALSYGTQTRLNVLTVTSGTATCKSSFDYSSGETTAAHKPVNLVQMADGKIYVLYQHSDTPKIVRYDFDGTTLSAAKTIFMSKEILGANTFGMIARTNKRLLVANPDQNALLEIAIKGDAGAQTDFYQKTSYAKDIKALIAEPL